MIAVEQLQKMSIYSTVDRRRWPAPAGICLPAYPYPLSISFRFFMRHVKSIQKERQPCEIWLHTWWLH